MMRGSGHLKQEATVLRSICICCLIVGVLVSDISGGLYVFQNITLTY